MEKNRVAVYGTLKKNKSNHGLMRGSFLGKGFVGKGYSLYVDGLPYLVKDSSGVGCEVELYLVDDFTLENLDYLEGHPSFYKREKVWVTEFESGHKTEAYIYIYQGIIKKNLTPIKNY